MKKLYAKLIIFLAKPLGHKKLPSGIHPDSVPVVRPLIVSFYTPTKLYISNCDPTVPPNSIDKTTRWLNAVTTKMFDFAEGEWHAVQEGIARKVKFDGALRETLVPLDPQAALDKWYSSLPQYCPVCGGRFVENDICKIPHLDQNSQGMRSVCEICFNRYHALIAPIKNIKDS